MSPPEAISDAVMKQLVERAADDQNHMNRMIKRISAGDQLEYVLGYQDFMGRRYLADRRAYIAQSDSVPFMHLVAEHCISLRADRGPVTVCEVGTGSGVLALHIAHLVTTRGEHAVAKVIATDIDGAALRLAQENVHRFAMESKVCLLESDLLAEVGDDEAVDLIFAYPPWGDRSPDDLHYPGSEWETFHQMMPPISCYPVGGDFVVHDGLLDEAAARFPKATVLIFNDYLPLQSAQDLAAKHGAAVVPCGQSMTALVRRGR